MDIATELAPPKARRRLSHAAQRRLLVAGLLVVDALALALALLLAYGVRFYSGLPVFVDIAPRFTPHVRPILYVFPLWLALFALFGLYAEHNLLGGTDEYTLVFNACTMGTMVVISAAFLLPRLIVSRGWLVLAWLFSVLCVTGARFLARRAVYALRRAGYFLVPALIVGANEEGRALAQQLQAWRTSGLQIAGWKLREFHGALSTSWSFCSSTRCCSTLAPSSESVVSGSSEAT